MRIPLEISFHGLSRIDSIEQLIYQDAAKLEKVCDRLISCRVGVKLDQKSSSSANPIRVRIEMRVPPGHSVVVANTTAADKANDDLQTTVKTTFKVAQRRLKQLVEKQHDDKKHHAQKEITI